MAKVSNPLIGSASGSVGGTTFSKWKGINVLKTKPTSVAQPASDKRTMRQSALSQIVSIYRSISSVISLTFKSLAIQQSAYNAFASCNLINAFDYSAPPAATIVYENLLISKGTIAPTPIISAIVDISEQSLTVTFPTTVSGANQSASDQAVLVVIDETQGVILGKTGCGARSTGTATMDLNYEMQLVNTIDVYLAFVNEAGTLASDSVNVLASVQA